MTNGANKLRSWKRPPIRQALAACDAIARVAPRTGLKLAARLGHAANRLSLYGPLIDEVSELYPWLPRQRLVEVAAQMTANDCMDRIAWWLRRRNRLDQLTWLITWRGADRLLDLRANKRAAILGTWHMGPLAVYGAGLKLLNLPVLMMMSEPVRDWHPEDEVFKPGGIEVCSPSGTFGSALALKRAYDYLRGNGLVFMTVDGGGSKTGEVPCLERLIRFRRGAITLARLTGAPIIPLAARWNPDCCSVTVATHAPLPHPTCPFQSAAKFEDAFATEAAKWLDAYYRTNPGQLRIKGLAKFLKAPHAKPPVIPPHATGSEGHGGVCHQASSKLPA